MAPVLEAMAILTGGSATVGDPAELRARAQQRSEATYPPEQQRAAARLTCGLAVLGLRGQEFHPPLRCAKTAAEIGLFERQMAELRLLGQGSTTPLGERLEALKGALGDADARVRAAAIGAAAWSWDEAPAEVEALLVPALEDRSTAVAGSAAEVVQQRLAAKKAAPGPAVIEALIRRGEAPRDGELFAGVAGALALAGGARAEAVCRAALTDPAPTVRTAAQACVKTLTGADPGPASPAVPAALPPDDPSQVLGGTLLWRLSTERGRIEIALDPRAAPWHVAAIVALTRRGFYDGLTFHRVVPGYVVQGGDPQGTGWGGPGYSLPSEPGEGRFVRGAVGIADAGKDSGGSQFFIMHARAPHLEGRYTRIGEVRGGLDAVDALIVGDRIVKAEIAVR